MALILLLCVMLPLTTTAMECPNGVEVNKTCYNLTHILDLKGDFKDIIVINQLGMLRQDRTLYYSFEPKLEDSEYSKVGFVNLDDPTKAGLITPPINIHLNLRYFDIDQDNALIYLGGTDGIYKLNTANNRLSQFISPDRTILTLFYNDTIYFVRDDRDRLEILYQEGNTFRTLFKDDRTTTRVEHLPKITVKKFVITNDNMVVFLSTHGLFAAKAEMNSKLHRLSKNPFFHGLAVDLDGEVYAWWVDGLYKVVLDVNPAKSTVVRVADITSIGALTFDDDNSILFTVGKSLFRLAQPYEEEC